jgi:hypothetical protein
MTFSVEYTMYDLYPFSPHPCTDSCGINREGGLGENDGIVTSRRGNEQEQAKRMEKRQARGNEKGRAR